MRSETVTSVAAGLRRVEGQVRGIQRMLDTQRYCVDVLIQMKAVRAALLRLEGAMLRDHVGTCVAEAFVTGDADDRAARLDELVEAIGRITR